MDENVIIIGSGIGGLTCGSFLAKHGFKVTILEQHFKPGGYVTSYKRNGFAFDVVHVIGGLKKGAPIERIFSYLGIDKKVDFIEVEKTFKFVYPDVTVDCYADVNKYERELINHFPDEKENIPRYFETKKKIWAEIQESYYRPNLFQMTFYPLRFPNLVRYQDITYREFLDRFFRNEKLKEILGSGWGYLGLNSPRISALFMIGMYMSYHTGGAWFPKGGYQAMSDSFADTFKKLGGVLRLKTGVKRVIVEKNRAAGVELSTGEKIRAKYIISNADTKQTFLNLVGEGNLSKGFADKIKGLRPSVSGFVVHLGVKMDLPEELNCGCVMSFPDYGTAEEQFKLAERNEMLTDPAKMGFGLSISTMKDPGLAPDGCHALDIIYMPAPYQYKDRWMSEDKERYKEFKEKIADNLIKAAEKLVPGLTEHIVVKDINTPLTYERYTSATEGCWYDAACTPDQSLLKRTPSKTPVEGLYLTGAKSFLGPGMFGAINSGMFTADIILKGKLTCGKIMLKEGGQI